MTVVAVDMRSWQAPEQADILVSELLGSFGDNELSPECLDGAQRFLKSNGISIPCSYTSHLQPITSAKLWSEVQVGLLFCCCTSCLPVSIVPGWLATPLQERCIPTSHAYASHVQPMTSAKLCYEVQMYFLL